MPKKVKRHALSFPYHPDYGLGDDARRRTISEVLQGHMTPAQAAEAHHVHKATVYKWLRDAGHPRGKPRHNRER